MGDMADDCTEAGTDALEAHNSGDCDQWCRYCRYLEREAKKNRRRTSTDGAGKGGAK